jgi:hypothetical protein
VNGELVSKGVHKVKVGTKKGRPGIPASLFAALLS